jgi:hypothetical protein
MGEFEQNMTITLDHGVKLAGALVGAATTIDAGPIW